MKKLLIWVVVILVAAAIVYSRVANRGDDAPARTIEEVHAAEGVPVDVVTVRTGAITVVRQITGEVSGIRQSTLRSSGAYKIEEVKVREGDRVRRGQVLARYDVDISPDRMARLTQVRESYENARRQVDRLEPLHKAGAIADSEMDAARTALAIAEADLRNARLELEVVSPLDGIATLIAVRAGDSVDAGDVIAQVAILDSVRVDANVSGDAIRELKSGDPVVLEDRFIAGGNTAGIDGRITRVALGADPDTRLFGVEAILDNADRILRPGLTVTLEVIVDRASPVTVMPHAAVVDERAVVRGSEHEVFVVADGTASLKKVEVGRVADEMVEVVSGVTDGDRVV
ncbi:MAG: efflux RND transporter periplasmic adaptor subunit, partial [Candidatus Latescibacterota bacterium]